MSGMTFTESDIALIKKLGGRIEESQDGARIDPKNLSINIALLDNGEYKCYLADSVFMIQKVAYGWTLAEAINAACNHFKQDYAIVSQAVTAIDAIMGKMTEEKE